MIYPTCLSEYETLWRVLDGRSLARYGDGEFNLCLGHSIPCQPVSERLQKRLREILKDSGECLVGIPDLHSPTPKAAFWNKYHGMVGLLVDREYASSFISRPDSAPWIDTQDYWLALESIWRGKDVTLVHSESWKSLQTDDLNSARSVREVYAPKTNAFADYDEILEFIGTPTGPVLICLGPTATVLAVDLCEKHVHAIDMGHIGLFLRKHRRGEPMTLTAADKAVA